jgi:hypothetical protein
MIVVAALSLTICWIRPSNIEITGSNEHMITHFFYVLFSGVGRGLAIGHLQPKGKFKVVYGT